MSLNVEQKKELFISEIEKFISYSSKNLPSDVKNKILELASHEKEPMAKTFYIAMLKNIELASESYGPICQDTGLIQFFIQVGTKFPLIDYIDECLRLAVIRATSSAPLRPNAIEPFSEKNTGTNTGTNTPYIETEIIPFEDSITVYVYFAGGGCSMPSMAKSFAPLDGYEGIVDFVFERMLTYGINACPPLILGLGIAGSIEVAAKLSKKALLRNIGQRNNDLVVASLEKRIEDGLNSLKIGAGGINGEAFVMGVHIEKACRHPASLTAALSVGCWVHRRAAIKIYSDMHSEYLSHDSQIKREKNNNGKNT